MLKEPHQHDINEKYWIIVFLQISFINLMRDQVSQTIDRFYRNGSLTHSIKKWVKIGIFATCELISISWQIYGNVIYYTEKSEQIKRCNNSNNGSFMMTMFLLLILGYCYFVLYAMFIGLLIYMKMRRLSRRRNNRSQTQQIMQSISRVRFSEDLFGAISEENECIICMAPFTNEDMVTKLDCPGKHYYHTACIEGWIQQGSNQCPMCRSNINEVGSRNLSGSNAVQA